MSTYLLCVIYAEADKVVFSVVNNHCTYLTKGWIEPSTKNLSD